MKNLSRTKLRKAARLAIAIHGFDLMEGIRPSDVDLTEEECQIIQQEAMKIAERLADNHPMNFGSVKECINYFR